MKKRKIGYVYSSISGRFPFRGEKTICFESKVEEAFLTKMSFNDSVLSIEEQPFTLEYETKSGKIATYTPDFLVDFRLYGSGFEPNCQPKPLLVEVKRREDLIKRFAEYKPKFLAAIAYCRNNDMRFKIYDESRIYGTYYDNILFLQRYQRRTYDIENERRILDYIKAMGNARVDHILSFLCASDIQRGIMLGQIWQLLVNKQIETDLSLPLRQDTFVWINDEYDEGGIL